MKNLTFEEAYTIEGLSKELKNKVAKRNELNTLLESENITLAIKTSTGNIVYEKKLSLKSHYKKCRQPSRLKLLKCYHIKSYHINWKNTKRTHKTT